MINLSAQIYNMYSINNERTAWGKKFVLFQFNEWNVRIKYELIQTFDKMRTQFLFGFFFTDYINSIPLQNQQACVLLKCT